MTDTSTNTSTVQLLLLADLMEDYLKHPDFIEQVGKNTFVALAANHVVTCKEMFDEAVDMYRANNVELSGDQHHGMFVTIVQPALDKLCLVLRDGELPTDENDEEIVKLFNGDIDMKHIETMTAEFLDGFKPCNVPMVVMRWLIYSKELRARTSDGEFGALLRDLDAGIGQARSRD